MGGMRTKVVNAVEPHDGADCRLLPGLLATTRPIFDAKEVCAALGYISDDGKYKIVDANSRRSFTFGATRQVGQEQLCRCICFAGSFAARAFPPLSPLRRPRAAASGSPRPASPPGLKRRLQQRHAALVHVLDVLRPLPLFPSGLYVGWHILSGGGCFAHDEGGVTIGVGVVLVVAGYGAILTAAVVECWGRLARPAILAVVSDSSSPAESGGRVHERVQRMPLSADRRPGK